MAETSQGGSARFCGQCGAPLLPDAKFCANCGATVQPGAAPAASRTAAAPHAKSNSKLWLALVAAVVLIGLIAVIVLVSQPKPATVSTAAIPTAAVPQDIPYPSVARVTPAQAHGSVNSGQAIIIDVRDAESYNQAHIEGAISMPESELPARIDELPQDQQIFTYCT